MIALNYQNKIHAREIFIMNLDSQVWLWKKNGGVLLFYCAILWVFGIRVISRFRVDYSESKYKFIRLEALET